jgi:hypothetical protein
MYIYQVKLYGSFSDFNSYSVWHLYDYYPLLFCILINYWLSAPESFVKNFGAISISHSFSTIITERI